jgi:hypothetical protein
LTILFGRGEEPPLPVFLLQLAARLASGGRWGEGCVFTLRLGADPSQTFPFVFYIQKEAVMTVILIIGLIILIAGVISTATTLYYLLSEDYEIDQRIQKFL